MKEEFSKLNPGHELFLQLEKQKPVWWQNLINNPDLYIAVRKDNYIDVYYSGGRIIDLSYTNKFKGQIHFEYIPILSKKDYGCRFSG